MTLGDAVCRWTFGPLASSRSKWRRASRRCCTNRRCALWCVCVCNDAVLQVFFFYSFTVSYHHVCAPDFEAHWHLERQLQIVPRLVSRTLQAGAGGVCSAAVTAPAGAASSARKNAQPPTSCCSTRFSAPPVIPLDFPVSCTRRPRVVHSPASGILKRLNKPKP